MHGCARNQIICGCFSVFPKTDYTYSPTSQCRYEIAPGVLAMPNMSRRSIHVNDNESTVISRRNLSQTSRGTTESGISDTDTVDLKETASVIQSVSILVSNLSSQIIVFLLFLIMTLHICVLKLYVLQSEDNYGMSRTRMSDSTGRATLYKKTRVEQYTSHKEVIYSEPGYSSDFRSRYFTLSRFLKQSFCLHEINTILFQQILIVRSFIWGV